jgi:Na+/proline symporter
MMPLGVATTTLTQVPAGGSAAALGLISMTTLVAYLIAREVAGTSSDEHAVRWGRGAMVAIAPLLLVFAVIVAEKIAHALR